MGKVGRFFCILTPMALSIASLICLLVVFLGSVNKNDSNLSNIYFMKADTSGFKSNASSTASDILGDVGVDNSIFKMLDSVVGSNLSDVYTVGIWNYCEADKNGTGGLKFTHCGSRHSAYWFDPIDVWGLNRTGTSNEVPKDLQKGLKAYEKVAKWMFAAYAVAFWLTVAEIAVGIFAIFSRWGSLVTTILTSASTFFTIAASITSTALYTTLVGTLDSVLKKYNIKASLGGHMMAVTWLAVAFSIGAGLFWFLSSCCCSGKSDKRGRKSMTVEKTPYTYERVESPYAGPNDGTHHTSWAGQQVPLKDMHNQKATAYEPFRHN
ncbi:uncharacterized protein K452DRAFT_229268 [Aplosporella prunicola CBS 121167]|uniref:Integral membrane protein n=1 Tax=Aplosporella prunicola CBS 121167 TaxID=1176127 RepID=A0A6A6BBC5_9PEZI|nr:uncharacterized protein K452DRAFT_229268 [Aplosporella prunicola CBS 121167]KAF2140898.1 hypothetical protein K452DRAFT_229268 [Aplosporella prunicola CBS 121167]